MSSWLNLAAIAMGGATGALCRYGITLAAAAIPGGSSMLGTTVANVLGCALLGALSALEPDDSELMIRLSLAARVGFLGSLTTFSTFTAESQGLAESGRWGIWSAYMMANLLIGWCALMIAGGLVRGWTE